MLFANVHMGIDRARPNSSHRSIPVLGGLGDVFIIPKYRFVQANLRGRGQHKKAGEV